MRKNQQLLLWSQLVSQIGSWIQFAVLPLVIFHHTGSLLMTGITYVIELLPALFVPILFGGVFDRFNKVNILRNIDLINSVLTLCLFLLVLWQANVVFLYIIIFVMRCIGTLYMPGVRSFLPDLAKEKAELQKLNAQYESISSITPIIGPLSSVIVLYLSREAAILINAGSFLVSAVLISLIHSNSDSRPAASGRISPLDGLHHIFRTPMLTRIMLTELTIYTLFGSVLWVTMLMLTADTYFSGHLGYILPGLGLGALVSTRYVAKNPVLRNYARTLGIISLTALTACLMLHLANHNIAGVILAFLGMLLLGATSIFISVSATLAFQSAVEAEVRGRVMTTRRSVIGLGQMLSLVLWLSVSHFASPSLAVLMIGITTCVTALLIFALSDRGRAYGFQ